MQAITVAPGEADSVRLDEVPEPEADEGTLLVELLALGVCGTDREIAAGLYGEAPPGEARLILGHESLGRVVEAPPGCDIRPGALVAGIVRRPDPVPCPACAGGEWDMCRNGLYTERGIKRRHGYGAERYRLDPEFAVEVPKSLGACGVLTEPASIVAKAWEHVDRIGARTKTWSPRKVMITGAGPVGLLAALMAVQRGHELHVFDRTETGVKPELVRDLGGTYHLGPPASIHEVAADIIIECTGADPVVVEAVCPQACDSIVCLTGVSTGGRRLPFDVGQFNREAVLENHVILGTVNANRRHFTAAVEALAKADRSWLERLITRRIPPERWRDAFENQSDDVKVVLDFGLASLA
jgi:threonine dehydrogenase-like Zn-dependent dehydrogenase